MTLSEAARSVWAKTGRHDSALLGESAPITHWLPLHQHLSDSAGIAAKLWDEGFWAPSIRSRLAERYDSDSAARAVTILLAENHDIGKASPAFAAQCPELTLQMGMYGLVVRQGVKENADRSAVRHEIVSYLAFDDWAADRGADRDARKQLASVLGVHHGRPLTPERVRLARERPALVGEGLWTEARCELLDRSTRNPEVEPHIDTILSTPLRQSDLVLLSGMLILTDWVASSEFYFPLFEVDADPAPDNAARVDLAWRSFSPPQGWRPDPAADDETLFRERFRLPEGASIHPAQREFLEVARSCDYPRLLILEAPMGSGKTEAALAAAEVLAEKFGANGLFVALPTQATSDGMFTRVHQWADLAGLGTSIFLAHGRSALNDEFEELWADPAFNSVDEEETGSGRRGRRDGSVVVHRWFAGSKKGPLSNLVVGTIDQVLFMALQSRHVTLRHLALAGKVVVIDEAHAFDVYMGEFLIRAVQWLGAYGVPTVILSATLPAERRGELARAYEEGRRLDRGERVSVRGRSIIDIDLLEGDIGYPVVIASGELPSLRLPVWAGREQRIELERISDDLQALAELLSQRMREGGCVAIVRNTVRRAQETAEFLRAEFPDTPVILAHSRFIAEDRARRDRELLDLFGSSARATGRPERAIVVATQVIEQSLDLDFDLMVSDLAPIDLLLQRSGRLHRHLRAEQERPTAMRSPHLVVTAVEWAEDPPAPESGTRVIYGEHLLLRTLAELAERERILLPSDIAPMVQRVYSDEPYGLPGWEAALSEAARNFQRDQSARRSDAKPFLLSEVAREPESLVGWAGYAIGDAESEDRERRGRAAVRQGGEDLEVFALFSTGSLLSVAPWWETGEAGIVPLNAPPTRQLVRAIQRSAIRIPEHVCRQYGRVGCVESRGYGIDLLIRDLERVTVRDVQLQGLQQAKELRGELMVVFDERGRCELPGMVLRYSERDGLRVGDE